MKTPFLKIDMGTRGDNGRVGNKKRTDIVLDMSRKIGKRGIAQNGWGEYLEQDSMKGEIWRPADSY